MGGYDAKTGKELWRLGGVAILPVPTPITGHNLIFIQMPTAKWPVYAIRPTATATSPRKGDVIRKRTYCLGAVRRGGGYLQTPLIYGDYF